MKRDLADYNRMRDFEVTDEPSGRVHKKAGHSFVVQKHAARALHYDFRLELDGVLLSWAVPKGPSLRPGDKRLAVQVEDHPVDYGEFEGSIPKGQYGGGSVIVWDHGTWKPIGDPREALAKGHLDFELEGEKLHGRFLLVRTRRSQGKKPSWLLMKRNDEHAATIDIVKKRPESVISGKTIDDVSDAKPKIPPFGSITPQLATLADGLPKGGDWIWEIKYDGYRTLAWIDGGDVTLASRKGLDWTRKYPFIAQALARLRVKTAVLDGEVAYVEEDGTTSFQKLQHALGAGASDEEQSRLVYYVFDVLHYDGVDLRDEPLLARKEKLKTILAGENLPLRYSDHITEHADTFFAEACKSGLEGIIGKRADKPYQPKRTPHWIKVKCARRQELVIVGFTPQKNSASTLGALLVGVREHGKLRYAGKVGTGFSHATLRDLGKQLKPLAVDKAPVEKAPRIAHATWVKPELVAEIRFTEWTSDGVLRHPSFEGLRLDKAPDEVEREVEVHAPKVKTKAKAKATPKATPKAKEPDLEGIKVSHPERVIDKESGATKLDLVHYASAVAEVMLPFVAKRPLMLLRCPGGTSNVMFSQSPKRKGASCFVQKHSGQGVGAANLGSAMLGDEEALYVTNTKQLVLLAQQNAIEIHGWGSTLPKWDRADWIVFDLDPDEALPFDKVIEAAFTTREALRTLGLESWVKTTGGKGLHVVVPIARRYDWDTIKSASHKVASLMAQAAPKKFVATMAKKARTGKIFIDYLRNAEGATAILPYSARARPGLGVAMPVAWDDLESVDPRAFTIATVPKILARRRKDPWADLLETHQVLPRELATGE